LYGDRCCWWACIFFTAAWGCWSRTKLLTVQHLRWVDGDVSHKRHNWLHFTVWGMLRYQFVNVPTSIDIYEWNMLTLLPSGNSCISAFHFLHVMFADAKRATGQLF
jgi:hypothetical protein